MRIISGKLRGKVLASIHGNAVRPTSDKIRGAIFSTLLSRMGGLEGKRVLDMFAGSAALSIEALSRGAARAVLIDAAPPSQQLALKNIAACRLEQQTHLIRGDALTSMARVCKEGPFDVVFIDPPYGKGLALKALTLLADSELLTDEGLAVVETERSEELPAEVGALSCLQRRDYGNTGIHYYHHTPA